jgi:hypothetical protein
MSTTTPPSGPAASSPSRQASQATGWAGWLVFAAVLIIYALAVHGRELRASY